MSSLSEKLESLKGMLSRPDTYVALAAGAVGLFAVQWTGILFIKLSERKHEGPKDPKHLFITVHGFSGAPSQMSYLTSRLMQDNSDTLAVAARCNWGPANGFFATGDGIDQGGRRLAAEIREIVAQYDSLETISVFGDGVGGLYARYASGLLFDKNKETVAGLKPLNFVSLATPHLGMRSAFLGKFTGFAARHIVGPTGKQLLLEDDVNFPEPLLLRMSEEGSIFMMALHSYRHKAFYSDFGSKLDGTFTSALATGREPRDLSALSGSSLETVDRELYPHVVSVHQDMGVWAAPPHSERFLTRYNRTDVESRIVRNLESVNCLRVAVHFANHIKFAQDHSYQRWTSKGRDVVDHVISQLSGRRPIRIWVDGCFDMMHFGHANAFRQSRALGDVLVVGLNPDSEIQKHKGGPPIMNDEERATAVNGCKWVDELVTDVPYALDDEWMQKLFDKYHIDFIAHGDDPCFTADGKDVYELAKRLGRFKTIKRTEGVSTTDLVGRMLMRTRDHHTRGDGGAGNSMGRRASDINADDQAGGESVAGASRVTFLPTTRGIMQFSNGVPPKPDDKVVYVDGSFDLFHAGHIRFLEEAKKLGDFLIVGLHSDDDVNKHRGANFPIMNLHERALGVLSCRHVDEIIMGAPWEVTHDMIVTMNITVVAVGTHSANCEGTNFTHPCYRVPKDKGILREISSPSQLSADGIVNRIVAARETFESKFEKKDKQEQQYYSQKTTMASK